MDNKIFIVRGIHPSEKAAYLLAQPIKDSLLNRGFNCEIISIPLECTITNWARELGKGNIPEYPLCLDSRDWPYLFDKEGYVFELHNTDLFVFNEIQKTVIMLEKGQNYYDIEFPAIFKKNGDKELEDGFLILKDYVVENHAERALINMEQYSISVDLEKTKKQGFLNNEIVEECVSNILAAVS